MDRLPTEILAKVCAYTGVGYFPSLRCVSREFNRACDVVSNQYEAVHGYPARLDHYSVADLARLGNLDLLRGMTLSDDERRQVCVAAFLSGQLDVMIAYRYHLYLYPLAYDHFTTAASEGHVDTIDYYLDHIATKPMRNLAIDYVKVGCVRRLRLYGYLPERLHIYMAEDVLQRYRTLYQARDICPDINIQEQLIFAVYIGRLALADACLARGAELKDCLLKGILATCTVEVVRWCIKYLQRTQISWHSTHRILKSSCASISRAASVAVLPVLLENGGSFPPLYVATKWGVPALSLLRNVDLDDLLLDLCSVAGNIDCIRYCIANGATTCREASERAALARNWKAMYICRAAANA